MKFELFQRLRGDSSDSDGASQQQGQVSPGLEDQPRQDMQPTGLAGQVETMFDQGYSEEEIKQELRGQYSDQEITDAVNQAVTDTATSTAPSDGPEPMTPYEGDEESDAASPMDEGYRQDNGPGMEGGQGGGADDTMQPPPPPPGDDNPPPQAQGAGRGAQQANTGMSQTEELVEAVVAENFQRVRAEFQNVYGEVDETQKTVEMVAEALEEMENSGADQQTEVDERINEIETQLESAQSRMDGMERAFQQVLPDLVENIRELTNLVQDLKEDSPAARQSETRSQEPETKDDIDEFTAFD